LQRTSENEVLLMKILTQKASNCQTNIFRLANRVPVQDIALRYMGTPKKGKWWRCPFHQEKEESFTYKIKFRCFGCGWNGGNVDLVMKLFGLSPLEAARLICRDFSIPIDDHPPTKEAMARVAEVRREREREETIKNKIEQTYKETALLHRVAFQLGMDHVEVVLADVLDGLQSREKARQIEALRYARKWWLA